MMISRLILSFLLCLFLGNPLYAQLKEENGKLSVPDLGIDTAKIGQAGVKRLVITQFRSAADTLKPNAPGETVLSAGFDSRSRLASLKGCIHEGSDPCAQEYNTHIYYNRESLISSMSSQHFDKGKQMYDSTVYTYNDKKQIASSEKSIVVLNSSEDTDTLFTITYYHYNDKGQVESREVSGYSASVYPKSGYEYDSNGRVTREIWYDEKGKIAEAYDLDYDPQGRLTGRKEYESGKLYCSYHMTLDKTGKCVEKKCYDSDDSLTLMQSFKYDRQGRLVDQYDEPTHTEVGVVTKFKYDDQGNLIEKKQTMANGKKVFRYSYAYNSSGLLIKEQYYDSDDELSLIYKYKYYFK